MDIDYTKMRVGQFSDGKRLRKIARCPICGRNGEYEQNLYFSAYYHLAEIRDCGFLTIIPNDVCYLNSAGEFNSGKEIILNHGRAQTGDDTVNRSCPTGAGDR